MTTAFLRAAVPMRFVTAGCNPAQHKRTIIFSPFRTFEPEIAGGRIQGWSEPLSTVILFRSLKHVFGLNRALAAARVLFFRPHLLKVVCGLRPLVFICFYSLLTFGTANRGSLGLSSTNLSLLSMRLRILRNCSR